MKQNQYYSIMVFLVLVWGLQFDVGSVCRLFSLFFATYCGVAAVYFGFKDI